MADFIRGYEEAIQQANTPKGTAYIVGMQIAQMVNQRILPGTREELKSTKDSINAELFSRGFVAALANDTTIFTEHKAGEFKKEALAGAGEKYLAANAKKPGVKVLPSGLQYKVIKEGRARFLGLLMRWRLSTRAVSLMEPYSMQLPSMAVLPQTSSVPAARSRVGQRLSP